MAQREQRAVQAAQPQQQQPQDGASRALVAVAHEIDNRLAIIGASAAAGIDPERLKQVALGAFTRTPALWTCEPISIARSIVEAGQLGLEPTGLLGGAYLVPRKGQCTLLVGYRGLVMLAKRSGEVARVEARVVRARDTFDYGYGLEPYVEHHPSREADPGEYTAAYAVIVYRDGGRQFDVMSLAEIESIRKRSSSPDVGPWVTDWPEMAKKTVLRRLLKLAPLTVNVASVLDVVDPEVRPASHEVPPDTRQLELRRELQAALEREAAPATTQATTDVGAGGGTAEPPAGQAEGAAAGGSAAAPQPTAQPVVLCGVSHAALGVGPCTLAAGHEAVMGQPLVHRDANRNEWTQPHGR